MQSGTQKAFKSPDSPPGAAIILFLRPRFPPISRLLRKKSLPRLAFSRAM